VPGVPTVSILGGGAPLVHTTLKPRLAHFAMTVALTVKNARADPASTARAGTVTATESRTTAISVSRTRRRLPPLDGPRRLNTDPLSHRTLEEKPHELIGGVDPPSSRCGEGLLARGWRERGATGASRGDDDQKLIVAVMVLLYVPALTS
jgi:hypothetical protein